MRKAVVSCLFSVARRFRGTNRAHLASQSSVLSPQSSAKRHGSVLLVVVVLLLLLAILGTSYLATTRVDREISAQDLTNTNIDAVMDGVRDLAMSQIVNGAYSTTITFTTKASTNPQATVPALLQALFLNAQTPIQYVPQFRANATQTNLVALLNTPVPTGTTITVAVPYNAYDVPAYSLYQSSNQAAPSGVPPLPPAVGAATPGGDAWLADRVPELPAQFSTQAAVQMPTGFTVSSPMWSAITAPLGAAQTFEDPTRAPTDPIQQWTTPAAFEGAQGIGAYLTVPAPVGIFPSFETTTVGQTLPTLTYSVLLPNGTTKKVFTEVAGDADGDGIADCGLIRLPGVYADGLTYYAGIRIVDNNSAVNVNTALDNQYDYTIAGSKPVATVPNTNNLFPSLFPSAVGLNEMLYYKDIPNYVSNALAPYVPATAAPGSSSSLAPYPQDSTLEVYRFGGVLSGPYVANYPYAYPPGQTATTEIDAIGDTPTSSGNVIAGDFGYTTLGDALYHQLSARLQNPGFADTIGNTGDNHYRAFGDADEADLIYHFGLLNPATFDATMYSTAGVPATMLETALPFSAYANAPNYPANCPLVNANRHKATSGYPPASTLATAKGLVPPWKSYPPTAAALAEWYTDNFNWAVPSGSATSFLNTGAANGFAPATNNGMNVRPFLVTRNAVSNTGPAVSPSSTVLTVPNAAMAPYGDRGRWQPNVLYNYTPGEISNGYNFYVSDDCVTFSASPQATGETSSQIPAIPSNANATNGYFSGVFFCRATTSPTLNVNRPPSGLETEVYNTTAAFPPAANAPYWARPSYWNPAQTYNLGDYVFADPAMLQAAGDVNYLIDGNRFYRLQAAPASTYPSVATIAAPNISWVVWQPPAWAMVNKANVNTAAFPELFRAFCNVMSCPVTATNVFPSLPNGLGTPFDVPARLAQPSVGVNPDIYAGSHFTASTTAQSTPIQSQAVPLPSTLANTNTTYNPQRMFRSSIRDNPQRAGFKSTNSLIFDPYQELMLRAAIAAVNTESIREPVNPNASFGDVIVRQVPLSLYVNSTGGAASTLTPVNAVICGNQPQPYITEVYAQTDTTIPQGQSNANLQGYVAVELYNPYPFDIPLIGAGVAGAADYSWQIALMDRSRATGLALQLQQVAAINRATYTLNNSNALKYGMAFVPHHGFLLLENMNPNTGGQGTPSGSAYYRPAASGLPLTGPIQDTNLTVFGSTGTNLRQGTYPALNTLFVPNLGEVVVGPGGGATTSTFEMVILRRRSASGAPSQGKWTVAPPAAGYDADGSYTWCDNPAVNPVNAIYDYVPVDSFDFSGLNLGSNIGPNSQAYAIHYARPTNTTGSLVANWQFIYPGRYDPSGTSGSFPQEGTQSENWLATTQADPWIAAPPTYGAASGLNAITLGQTNAGSDSSNANTFGTYSAQFPIQLNYAYYALNYGPFTSMNPSFVSYSFPFGGFARNGDILQVPYIAGYQIRSAANPVNPYVLYEMNAPTMDASFAEDTDTTDDPATPGGPAVSSPPTEQVGRFCPLIPTPTGTPWDDTQESSSLTPNPLRYGWAGRLFDYLTVQDPHNDYFPNTDPSVYPTATMGNLSSNNTPPPYPTPVANSNPDLQDNLISNGNSFFTDGANTEAENTQGVEGLVNINTAPLQVLEALPLAVIPATGLVDETPDPNFKDAFGNPMPKNEVLAQAIISWRQGITTPPVGTSGPITNLFDLNQITYKDVNGNYEYVFASGDGDANGGAAPIAPTTPAFSGNGTAGEGDLTPGSAITNQFDESNLQITRLSNLITTRSDTFTVYIVVEGWQNAGSSQAKLVVTRRMAYIVDRNGLTPTSKSVKVIPVDNN
jgi:hypothetical protein